MIGAKQGPKSDAVPVSRNAISTHLVRLIYHRRPTIGMRRPSASSALRFLTHDVIKKTSLCWALYRMYARPIEIVIRPKSYFDFHVSDTYVFAIKTDENIPPGGNLIGFPRRRMRFDL